MNTVKVNRPPENYNSTRNVNLHELDYNSYLHHFQRVAQDARNNAVCFMDFNALLGQIYDLTSTANSSATKTPLESLVDLAQRTPILSEAFFHFDLPADSIASMTINDIDAQLNAPEIIRLSNLACLAMISECQSIQQFHSSIQDVKDHYWRLKNQIKSEFQNAGGHQFSILTDAPDQQYFYSGFMSESEPFGVLKAIFKQNIYNIELGKYNHQRLIVKLLIEKKSKLLARRIQKLISDDWSNMKFHLENIQQIILNPDRDNLINFGNTKNVPININHLNLASLEGYLKILNIILSHSSANSSTKDFQQIEGVVQGQVHKLISNQDLAVSTDAVDLRLVKKDYQKLNKLLNQV